MARPETIAWLHRTREQKPQLRTLQQPEDARAKSDNLPHSQATVSALPSERGVRGRFVLGRAAPEAGYQLTAPEIMSYCCPSVGMDRDLRFQALRERERFEQLARLAARRMIR
jgi:hypothetical protein